MWNFTTLTKEYFCAFLLFRINYEQTLTSLLMAELKLSVRFQKSQNKNCLKIAIRLMYGRFFFNNVCVFSCSLSVFISSFWHPSFLRSPKAFCLCLLGFQKFFNRKISWTWLYTGCEKSIGPPIIQNMAYFWSF